MRVWGFSLSHSLRAVASRRSRVKGLADLVLWFGHSRVKWLRMAKGFKSVVLERLELKRCISGRRVQQLGVEGPA